MKKAIILVTMMTFCLASGVALAKTPDPAPVGPDWDAAYEFGVLMSTDIDENGVVWETYYDEAQELMWTQTAGATKEQALESLAAGSVPIDEEGFVAEGALSEFATSNGSLAAGGVQPNVICMFTLMVPHQVIVTKSGVSPINLTGFYAMPSCPDDPDNSHCTAFKAYSINYSIYNANGYVRSVAKNTTDFCQAPAPGYRAKSQYAKLKTAGWPWTNATNSADDNCFYDNGSWWFPVQEDVQVDGNNAWDYGDVGIKPVGRHQFYACEWWQYVETWIDYQEQV